MHVKVPRIKSNRLLIRPVIHKDGKSVFQLRTDPKVNQWVKRSKPSNLADAIAYIDKCNQQVENDECVYWGIQEQGSEEMIGSISLWNYSADRKTAELGYDLLAPYWNRGYLSELFPLVLNYGFQQLHFNRIEAFTQKQNAASIRLLEKHHFILDMKQSDPDNADNLIFICKPK